MQSITRPAMLLAALTLTVTRTAAADDHAAHLKNVADAIYDARMELGARGLGEARLGLIHKCVSTAEAALKDGVPESAEIELKVGFRKVAGEHKDAAGARRVSVGAVRAACADTVVLNVIDKHMQGLFNPVIYLRKLKDPANRVVREAEVGLKFADSCEKTIEAAMADGVPADYEIKFMDYPPARASEFKTKVCAALRAEAQGIMDEGRAAMEAKLAPFRAVLKGDKLRIFEEQKFAFYGAYGKDCQPLSAPEDYARSAAFYVIIRDTHVVPPRWTVRGWTFDGHKLVRGPFEKSGSGGSAPASACR